MVQPKMRKTITFNSTAIDVIESYRRRNKEIPSFTNAVNNLIIMLNLDNGTRIRIEEYAKDCNIGMSEAYSDIIRIGLEIVGNKNNVKMY